METKNTSRFSSWIHLVSLAVTAYLLIGCGGAPKRNTEEEIDQLPVSAKRKLEPEVAVVIGPGMARALAAAGVFRALSDSELKIKGVVATEMGALIAALWSKSRSVNEFDWSLLKIKRDLFLKGGFSLRRMFEDPAKGRVFKQWLEKTFGNRRLKDLKPPVIVGIRAPKKQEVLYIEDGKISDVLQIALADPYLVETPQWQSFDVQSLVRIRPFPVDAARAFFGDPVVAVNVVGSARSTLTPESPKRERQYVNLLANAQDLHQAHLERADVLIEPDLGTIGFFDFKKRSDVVYLGQRAVAQKLPDIKKFFPFLGTPGLN
jgi:NTE family protein